MFHELVRLSGATTTYTDRSLRGKILTYQIVTHSYYGNSPARRSEPIIWRYYVAPRGPSRAVLTVNGPRARLTWSADSTAEQYEIKRSTNGGPFLEIAVVPATQLQYQEVQPVARKATPSYQILSLNHYGPSAPVPAQQEPGGLDTSPDSNGPIQKPR